MNDRLLTLDVAAAMVGGFIVYLLTGNADIAIMVSIVSLVWSFRYRAGYRRGYKQGRAE